MGNLVQHIQGKIKSLKGEIDAIKYTMQFVSIETDRDNDRLNECKYKIQVLNEVLMTFVS